MSGRVGRRAPARNDGYLTSAESREFNARLKAREQSRGETRTAFKTFSFRKPTTAPTAMPAAAPALAPAKPVPSVADIVAYLEQQQAAAELEAGKQALQFTRLFGQQGEDTRAAEYRTKTLELLGVMDALSTSIRHIHQQAQ